MTVDELPEYLKQHGLEIGEPLRNGTYHPQPVRRVETATSMWAANERDSE